MIPNRNLAIFFLFFLLVGCTSNPTEVILSTPTEAFTTTFTPFPLPPTETTTQILTPTTTRTPSPSPTASASDLLLDAAKAEGQLNVIALPHNWMNYGEVITAFSQKYGITVNELQPNAGSLEELEAIRAAHILGNQDAPDVIDVGLSYAVQAKNEELLQPYRVATWGTIPDNMKDSEGYWYGDYYGVIVFEVNTETSLGIPVDWNDLLTPGYKVALGGTPLESYQARMGVYAASLANGGSLTDIVPGLRFFQELNNAGNLTDIIANSDTIASGETPIVLSWDYLALADRYAQAGEREIVVVVPKSGVLAGLYAQAISVYAPHPNAAKLWMEFLYSDEGQILWLKGFGHPVRFDDLLQRGIIPQDLLAKLPPAESYSVAVFPTSEQLNLADKAVLVGWSSYFP